MAGRGVELKRTSGKGPVIGIDLGTTYSVVAVCRRGRTEILCNDSGSRTTPSVVGFLDGESFVGDAAKDLDSASQIFDAKRLIGRSWNDQDVQRDLRSWPFVVEEREGVPRIRMNVGAGRTELFAPEEISAMVLRNLKETAERCLDEPVTRAVITVPAYFNERQRKATMDAGMIAELEVIGIISEPTAAAIAYGLDKKSTSKKTIFVFDLGGGTFDVSVMTIEGSDFQVLASGGDSHLGGQDFDMRLVDFLSQDIRAKHGVQLDAVSLQELRKACELTKRKLSSVSEAPVTVFFPRFNLTYKNSVSRACFEDLCGDFFKKSIEIAKGVLKDSKVGRDSIDEVVLVGGSTRIPRVRAMLKEMFGNKEPRNSINPDEAVAYGAAVHAAVLNGDKFFDKLVNLKDVTPLSLGVEILGGLFSAVIPKNTAVPCEITKVHYPARDYQKVARISVYQGERPLVKDNHFLNKEFTIDIPSKPAREVLLDVTFRLDADGLLTVTCEEQSTGERRQVTVSSQEKYLKEKDIQEMIQKAERFRHQDQEEKARIEDELRRKLIL